MGGKTAIERLSGTPQGSLTATRGGGARRGGRRFTVKHPHPAPLHLHATAPPRKDEQEGAGEPSWHFPRQGQDALDSSMG